MNTLGQTDSEARCRTRRQFLSKAGVAGGVFLVGGACNSASAEKEIDNPRAVSLKYVPGTRMASELRTRLQIDQEKNPACAKQIASIIASIKLGDQLVARGCLACW